MTVLSAALDTDVGKIDKREVRQRIHSFGGVWSGIVVLREAV